MKYAHGFILIAVLLTTAWLWSFSSEQMAKRQRDHEAARLASLGHALSFSGDIGECAPSRTRTGHFVRFCTANETIAIRGDADWDRVIGQEEALKLSERWITPYLRAQQPEQARYAAARMATLVARDRLGATIPEPLPPILRPLSGDIANRSPSRIHRMGTLLAVATFALCMLLAWAQARRTNSELTSSIGA